MSDLHSPFAGLKSSNFIVSESSGQIPLLGQTKPKACLIDNCLNSFIWIVLEKEPFCDVWFLYS